MLTQRAVTGVFGHAYKFYYLLTTFTLRHKMHQQSKICRCNGIITITIIMLTVLSSWLSSSDECRTAPSSCQCRPSQMTWPVSREANPGAWPPGTRTQTPGCSDETPAYWGSLSTSLSSQQTWNETWPMQSCQKCSITTVMAIEVAAYSKSTTVWC